MSHRYFYLPALLLTVLLSAVLLSACSTSQTARPVAQVRTGQIEHVKVVTINDTSGIGSITGGIVGGILAGKHIGNGSGSTISSVFGALLGGFLGNQMERQIAQKTAQELTIRMLDNNERLVVVQEDPQVFTLGQTVDVISSGQTARVQAQEQKK